MITFGADRRGRIPGGRKFLAGVADGPCEGDTHVIATARAILRDGGRRPEDQTAIAVHGGPTPEDEAVVLRIWPERGEPRDPDGPPF
ncbi:hypothetical protein AB0K80_31510 [Streptomyces sp. NPDC052682]|uniref:hypothetical protein n=1 Tax=Streptomyces sp. NPDC052682 TaxID=3154954 RepID=UPI0034327BDC